MRDCEWNGIWGLSLEMGEGADDYWGGRAAGRIIMAVTYGLPVSGAEHEVRTIIVPALLFSHWDFLEPVYHPRRRDDGDDHPSYHAWCIHGGYNSYS